MSSEYVGGTTWAFDPLWVDETVHDEVVRCMDCDYRRGSWNGHRPNFESHFFCARTGGHEVEPDGFCAWGEVRNIV